MRLNEEFAWLKHDLMLRQLTPQTVHQHYGFWWDIKILRLVVGVALVPIGALITFTVKTKLIFVSQQEKRAAANF